MRAAPIALAAVAAASLAFGVAPTAASSGPSLDDAPYMTTDLAGDANGLRQGFLVNEPVPQTSTGPASVAHADILGARITSVTEETVAEDGTVAVELVGLEFRTGLTAEPSAMTNPMIHRFTGTAGGCELWVQAYTGTGGQKAHNSADVRAFEGCGYALDPNATLPDSETTANGISAAWDAELGELVVTLTFAEMDANLAEVFEIGEFYSLAGLHNRNVTNAVVISATTPQLDDMPGPGFTRIGDDLATSDS